VNVASGPIHGRAVGIAIDTSNWTKDPPKWVHRLSERHGGGANLSFLDGHVEFKSWRYPKREKQPPQVALPSNQADREDLDWFMDRTYVGHHPTMPMHPILLARA
jgi:prepilin-type processing-associated H-X9-DG protein